MIKIDIKPISTNEAWQGQRFKTAKYKAFEKALLLLLPKSSVPGGKLGVYYEFGVSSKLADYDNFIKQTQDIISKKYGFNDNKIYHAEIKKVDVKKGEEYIKFEIKELLE